MPDPLVMTGHRNMEEVFQSLIVLGATCYTDILCPIGLTVQNIVNG